MNEWWSPLCLSQYSHKHTNWEKGKRFNTFSQMSITICVCGRHTLPQVHKYTDAEPVNCWPFRSLLSLLGSQLPTSTTALLCSAFPQPPSWLLCFPSSQLSPLSVQYYFPLPVLPLSSRVVFMYTWCRPVCVAQPLCQSGRHLKCNMKYMNCISLHIRHLFKCICKTHLWWMWWIQHVHKLLIVSISVLIPWMCIVLVLPLQV